MDELVVVDTDEPAGHYRQVELDAVSLSLLTYLGFSFPSRDIAPQIHPEIKSSLAPDMDQV